MNKNKVMAGIAIGVSTIAITAGTVLTITHFTKMPDELTGQVSISTIPLPTYTVVPTKAPPKIEESDREINNNGSSSSANTGNGNKDNGNKDNTPTPIPTPIIGENGSEDNSHIIIGNLDTNPNASEDVTDSIDSIVVNDSKEFSIVENYGDRIMLRSADKSANVAVRQMNYTYNTEDARKELIDRMGMTAYYEYSKYPIEQGTPWNTVDGIIDFGKYLKDDTYNPTISEGCVITADSSFMYNGVMEIKYLLFYNLFNNSYTGYGVFKPASGVVISITINSDNEIDCKDYITKVIDYNIVFE